MQTFKSVKKETELLEKILEGRLNDIKTLIHIEKTLMGCLQIFIWRWLSEVRALFVSSFGSFVDIVYHKELSVLYCFIDVRAMYLLI